jgi:hypothetical protein
MGHRPRIVTTYEVVVSVVEGLDHTFTSKSLQSLVERIRTMALSQFSSGPFRAMFAMKEIWNSNEIHRRVSA